MWTFSRFVTSLGGFLIFKKCVCVSVCIFAHTWHFMHTHYFASYQRNATIKGVDGSNYLTTVDRLTPYTVYTFRIRCSGETFWKWSKWSNEKQYLTTEASKLTKWFMVNYYCGSWNSTTIFFF